MTLKIPPVRHLHYKWPKYTLEFKQDAAKVNGKGYTQQQAATSLGIFLSAIGRWVRAEGGLGAASSKNKALNLKKSVAHGF